MADGEGGAWGTVGEGLPRDTSRLHTWARPAETEEDLGPHPEPETGAELGGALFELQLEPSEDVPVAPVECAPSVGADARMTCCICLGDIPLENFASVSGCEHQYCTGCILQWAVHVEERRAAKPPRALGPYAAAARGAGGAGGVLVGEGVPCPICRLTFEELLTYRGLDGAFRDYLLPESIHLLTRAPWFRTVRALLKAGKGPATPGVDFDAEPEVEDYHLEEEEDYYDEADYYGCDEKYAYQVRQTGAGKARVVVGNRRWGNGGYVSSGRLMARPRVGSGSGAWSSSSGQGSRSSRAKAGRSGKGKSAPLGGHVDSRLSLSCSLPPLGSSPLLGSLPCKNLGSLSDTSPRGLATPPPGSGEDTPRQGRRAKRAAKRASQKVPGAA